MGVGNTTANLLGHRSDLADYQKHKSIAIGKEAGPLGEITILQGTSPRRKVLKVVRYHKTS